MKWWETVWLLLVSFGVMCLWARTFTMSSNLSWLRRRLDTAEEEIVKLIHGVKVSMAGKVLPVDTTLPYERHDFKPGSPYAALCAICEQAPTALLHFQPKDSRGGL